MNGKHRTSSKQDWTKPWRKHFLWAIVCPETSKLKTGAAWVSVQEPHHILALLPLFPGHLLKSDA